MMKKHDKFDKQQDGGFVQSSPYVIKQDREEKPLNKNRRNKLRNDSHTADANATVALVIMFKERSVR